MPKFTERTALKEVVKFATREFREKKPHNAKVLRVKDEKIFSKGGPLPTISLKRTQVSYYLVILDYGDVYRLYHFTKDGTLIFGENVEKKSETTRQIEKMTIVEYPVLKKKIDE
ncbi:MAG: hypothetical protein ACFFA3_19240 [Promethearchaeota archaeon]